MKINITEAMPGMVLDKPVVRGNVILVEKGETLSLPLIDKLEKRFRIETIDIVSNEKTEVDSNSNTISEQLIRSTKTALLEYDATKIEENASSMVSAILKNVDFNGSFSNLKFNLEACKDKTDEIDACLDHSIRVATFSIILAYLYNERIKRDVRELSELKLRLIDYRDITIASLLHDSGQFNQSEEILKMVKALTKTTKLVNMLYNINDIPTDRFDNKYKEFYSFCVATKLYDINYDMRYMILFSDENENNTGPLKPKAFDDKKTHRCVVGAKIIRHVNLYDNYLSHCINNGDGLENIVAILGQASIIGVVNKQLTDLFLENIPIYPVGTKVVLSNGERAVVVKPFTGYTYASRPVVRLLNSNKIVRLNEENSIVILGVADENVDMVVNDQLKDVDTHISKRR